jgi:predicted metal-dependent hydrolase
MQGLCEVIGGITGSIKRTKKYRNDARGVRDNAVNVLNARKTKLDAARRQLTSSQQQLANKRKELTSVNQQLNGQNKAVMFMGRPTAHRISKIGPVLLKCSGLRPTFFLWAGPRN